MEYSEAEAELKITKIATEISDRIIKRCLEHIHNAQHECEAWRMFENKENVKRFYSAESDRKIDSHLAEHNIKDKWVKGAFALLSSGLIYQLIKGFVFRNN